MERLRTTTSSDTGLEVAKLLGGAAAGALLMYMLDPDRGSARRAQSAAAVRQAGSRTTDALGNVWRGAGARIGSAADDLREGAADMLASNKPDVSGIGSTLSRLGRAASSMLDDTMSKARSAVSHAGEVADDTLSKAKSTASDAADAAGNTWDDARRSASRGFGRAASSGGNEVANGRQGAGGAWGSTARNSAMVGGGLLALMGMMRRSPLGLVLGLAGAALLARGAANQPLRSMVGRPDVGSRLGLGQTIDFQKTIYIDAAPEDIYDLWTNYENFPRFMSHVVEVRDLGRRRSHWVVKGPGGTEFAWNSVMTEQSRPHRLAWRSEPGAEIPQSGSIQFEAHRGGTFVTVRMSYTPPAGAIGHGLAMLLGSDPKAKMDEDLARMKAFVERGAIPPEAAQPRSSSRFLH